MHKCGAGDGNRTHGTSLGSWGITIIRRPHGVLIKMYGLSLAKK